MHKHRVTTIVMGVLLASLAALVLGACGSSGSSTSSSASASPSASKAEQILGHAPTGLAKQIVDNGYFTAANDANYAPQSIVKKDGSLVGFDVDTAKKVGGFLKSMRDTIVEAAGPPDASTRSVWSLLKRYWRAFQERRQRQWLRASLHDLSDRELMDIGVTRAEIDYIAAHRAVDRLRDGTAYLWISSRGVM